MAVDTLDTFVETRQPKGLNIRALGTFVVCGAERSEQDPRARFLEKHAEALGQYEMDLMALDINTLDGPDAFNDICERDWQFYSKVRSAITEAAKSNEDTGGNVVLLTDRDKTVWEGVFPDVALRVAYKAAVDDAYEEIGERLRVGELTSLRDKRGESVVARMANIDPRLVDTEFIIDTRSYLRAHPEVGQILDNDDEEEILTYLEGTIRPEIIKATRDGELELSSWYDPDGKHLVLQDLVSFFKRTGSDTRLVFVDDMVTATVINPEEVIGVHVGPEMQNHDDFRPRHPAGMLAKVLEAAGVKQ